jgi:hypothetical protein
MRSRAPYTLCRIFYDSAPEEAPPQAGDFILTKAGSAYRVENVKQNRNQPQRRNLQCQRWPADQIPKDARVLPLVWYPRVKRSKRLSQLRRP